MSAFEVFVLGVGDAFSEIYRPSALLLRYGRATLAIDCPDMYRGALRQASEASGHELHLSEIDDLLLTHVHGDHINGLEAVAFYKGFIEGTRLRLWSPPEVLDGLWETRLAASMGQLWDGQDMTTKQFDDYFDATPIPWDTATQIGPFTVRTRPTIHHVPTCALRIEAGGRTFGYSCDTAYDPGLIDWLSEADLIVHETNYGPAHTPYETLAALPAALRARMRLIHYHDVFDVEASAIRALREGERLVV